MTCKGWIGVRRSKSGWMVFPDANIYSGREAKPGDYPLSREDEVKWN